MVSGEAMGFAVLNPSYGLTVTPYSAATICWVRH